MLKATMDSPTLTGPQIKALRYLGTVNFATPAQIGEAMGGTRRGVAQGLGRLGGAMGTRLVRMGLARDASRDNHGYAAYAITSGGRLRVEGTE